MTKLYDYSRIYGFVKRFVMLAFRQYYGEFVINGKENLPESGPIIYTSNHTNALMDPLAIMSVLPSRTPVVYLARSDYFKNKWIRRLMLYFKILPAFRMREGLSGVDKNYEVFDHCLEVLAHDRPLGIMPEGSQGFSKEIRQLAKGTFRIAFAAQERAGFDKSVKIVPIGIDLEDFEKFGKRIIINIGKPIEVASYMGEYHHNQAKAINRLRDTLRKELIDLTLHIPSAQYYNAIETAAEVANGSIAGMFNIVNDTMSRFRVKQKIAEHLVGVAGKKPEVVQHLEATCTIYRQQLTKLNLPDWIFEESTVISRLKMAGIALLLLIGLPVFLPGLLLNLIPFLGPDFIIKTFKLQMPGGLSSIRFGIGLLVFPVMYVIQAYFICQKFQWSIMQFLILIPLQFFLGKFSFRWYRQFQRLRIMLRFRRLQRNDSAELRKTVALHSEICGLVASA